MAIMQDRISSSQPAGDDLPVWAIGGYLILATVVLFYSFAEHPGCLFTGTDGDLLQIIVATEKLFVRPFSQLGIDPLNGMFDANWPENHDYFFSEMVGAVLAGGEPSKPLIYTSCSVFIILCGYIMARALGTSRSVAVTAAMLVPIAIMPVFQGESPAYVPLYNIQPNFTQGIGLWMLFVAALWRLCGRWNAGSIAWLLVD